MSILIVDIDGTLSDAAWREPMIKDLGWDEFHASARDDQSIRPIANLVRTLHNNSWWVLALTGRPEKWRQMTTHWLIQYSIPVDEIIMRPNDSYEAASTLKLSQVMARFPSFERENILLIDNSPKIVDAFRAAGIMALLA